MSAPPLAPATRLGRDDLVWLLGLRPRPAATLAALALGLPEPDGAAPADADALTARGVAQRRRGELLPAGEAAVVGDVLTGARALVQVATTDGLAALVAVGRDRVLLLSPATGGAVEVAALAAEVPVGEAVAALAERAGPRALVLLAIPAGARAGVSDVPTGTDLAARLQELLP